MSSCLETKMWSSTNNNWTKWSKRSQTTRSPNRENCQTWQNPSKKLFASRCSVLAGLLSAGPKPAIGYHYSHRLEVQYVTIVTELDLVTEDSNLCPLDMTRDLQQTQTATLSSLCVTCATTVTGEGHVPLCPTVNWGLYNLCPPSCYYPSPQIQRLDVFTKVQSHLTAIGPKFDPNKGGLLPPDPP